MRERYFRLWAALGLLWCVTGAWAQADNSTAAQSLDTLKIQAENGDANAQLDLGLAYRDGHGVPQDFVESYFWLDLAASHIANGSAQEEAARKARDEVASHLTSSVLLETQERAKQWFESHQLKIPAPGTMSSSSAQGERPSGNCSPGGSDDASRVVFFTCECSKGGMDACASLGIYYRMGWGVSKDLSHAMALFKEACDGGSGSGCTLLNEVSSSSSPSTQNAAPTGGPPATSPLPNSFANSTLESQSKLAITQASKHPTSRNSGGCVKNISFAVAEGGQVVPRTPQFTEKWIAKNNKKYSGLCFSQTPNPQAANFVLIFSTSRSAFNGIFPIVKTSTSTDSSPISGSGTITSNSGSMWSYTYQGTETTTTTTTTHENLPYTDTTSTLYVNAYRQNGALISQRWRSVTTRQGGEGANTLGYNLGAALAAIHIKERLLKDAVEDVVK